MIGPSESRSAENHGFIVYEKCEEDERGSMDDPVFSAFLRRQLEEGMALAEQSDLIRLLPWPGSPPDRYTAHFFCWGLVRTADGAVMEHDRFEVDIWFPAGYLQGPGDYPRELTFEVLSWISPCNVFHPNISDVAPFICAGHIDPGTSLVQLLEQCFDIITYNKVTMLETDSLNRDACVWARNNKHRLPLDKRSLKRRHLNLQLASIDEAGK